MRKVPPALLGCALCCHLMCLPVWGQTQSDHNVQRSQAEIKAATAAFRAGAEASARGDLKDAEKSFRSAVRLAPKVAAAHTALGSVLRATGQIREAETELSSALRLDPNDRVALLNLAIVESLERKDSESVKTLDRLDAVDPELAAAASVEAAIPLATALSRTGDTGRAEKLLQQASDLHPEDASIADALGTIEAAQGKYTQAQEQLQKAVTLDDRLASAHFHLGAVWLALHQLQPAVEQLERAHSIEPDTSSYTLQLAHALDQAGAEARVVTLLQSALLTESDDGAATEMHYRLALALQAEGRAQNSVPEFAAVLNKRPRDMEVLINAGLALVQTGDAKGGIALYLRALSVAPATATLRENLGVAYLQQNNLTEALQQFHEGLKLDPDNPQLHYDLGLAFKLKDNLNDAIPEFKKATLLDPLLPDPPYTLGVIYMQQGQFQKAAEMLTKATELRPDNGDAWATLGSVYRELAEPEKAEQALRQAITLLPSQPSPHINLASVLMAEGKKGEAVAERKRGAELTRIAVNRQQADFALKSGAELLQHGKLAEALVQYQNAVHADPQYFAAHAGLAAAYEQAGRKGEAAIERHKAADLSPAGKS